MFQTVNHERCGTFDVHASKTKEIPILHIYQNLLKILSKKLEGISCYYSVWYSFSKVNVLILFACISDSMTTIFIINASNFIGLRFYCILYRSMDRSIAHGHKNINVIALKKRYLHCKFFTLEFVSFSLVSSIKR